MEVVSILGEMKGKMNFEETELRLGLPGNIISKVKNSTISHVTNSAAAATNGNGKRGFAETTNHVDLKLNLVSSKHVAGQILDQAVLDPVGHGAAGGSKDSVVKPPAKAQVVGWPPVRSYRKNMVCIQKAADSNKKKGDLESEKVIGAGTFVKVSVDGAPYLRKVDLNMYNTYQQLSDALGNMFSSFTIGKCGNEGMMDFMNESKLIDLLNNSDYVPTYQDKDGDWMLVGDVPWDMFVGSCKRLRIMKGAEAIGLAPRAVEKCKNRT